MALKHLSIEEITKYVETRQITEDSLKLVSRVNNHIRECAECNEKVTAYEFVYEKMRRVALQTENKANMFDADAMLREHSERIYNEMQDFFVTKKNDFKKY